MAQAAWQVQTDSESDIVRRLVARPLRLVPQAEAAPGTIAQPLAGAAEDEVEDEPASSDLLRLRTEVTLMKAVVKAERSENAILRTFIEATSQRVVSADDVRQVRDRWAALVDQLLRQSR